ncbi:MAG: hypothetical protein ABSF44_14225 [Candidatus Bathyarchaeia archaeon]|jgi:hypothetical protein
MSLFKELAKLEDDPKLHTARLLVLLRAFAGKNGTDEVAGKTKLVKLDFLLRYPVYLEQALMKRNQPIDNLAILEYERRSVESAMIRYKYGPWDPRYDTFLNLLIGMGLCEIRKEGRTVYIGLTCKGIQVADELTRSEEFEITVNRAHILKRFFDESGTNLRSFIYETFPEITSLKSGEKIKI